MKRCKHTSANWSRWEDGEWVLVGRISGPPLGPHGRFFKDRLVCDVCGEWLSLGEANDGGEHAASVALEKRAVELAQLLADADALCDWTFGCAAFGSDEERRGWSIAESNMQHHSNEWQAGYLARVIATRALTAPAKDTP